MLSRWDHTAFLATAIHHLQYTVCSLAGKPKHRPKNFYDCHPYRKEENRPKHGMTITPKNITDLQVLGDAMARG